MQVVSDYGGMRVLYERVSLSTRVFDALTYHYAVWSDVTSDIWVLVALYEVQTSF